MQAEWQHSKIIVTESSSVQERWIGVWGVFSFFFFIDKKLWGFESLDSFLENNSDSKGNQWGPRRMFT